MATLDDEEPMVIIVGAGPAGLATSACLNKLSIPNLILEKEDCYSPMWKKYSYDRVHLHLAKQFCQLPYIPFPPSSPTYVPKKQFIQYLDDYVSYFNITPLYNRKVEFAKFDESTKKWNVKVTNGNSDEMEEYFCKFLVVATGEASYPFIPDVPGLGSFNGEAIHSTQYKNGDKFKGKSVLVVGCGNSGMEIALDLANHGANTSIIVRSPVINFIFTISRYIILTRVNQDLTLITVLVVLPLSQPRRLYITDALDIKRNGIFGADVVEV